MQIKRTLLASTLLFSLSFFFNTSAFAAGEDLWTKGSSYGTFLAGSNMNREMNILSVSADKTLSGGVLVGKEHVRAWGRQENMDQIYSPNYYGTWIEGFNIRLYSDDSRRWDLYINGINPPDQSSGTLPDAFWDILGLLSVPTDTISAYANYIYSSGVSTEGFGSWDVKRIFKGTDETSKVSLPNSIPYSKADVSKNGVRSGINARFKYDLVNSNLSSLNLWPQAKVQYAVFHYGTSIAPTYLWTNYAGVRHTVN